MKEVVVTVNDGIGFHARTASVFAKIAAEHKCEVMVKFIGKIVNGKSMLTLMSLGIKSGMDITIVTEGVDEDDAINNLKRLVENKFEL